MLTAICGDLLVRRDDEKLTAAEARHREARRRAIVRLLKEIAAPINGSKPARGIALA